MRLSLDSRSLLLTAAILTTGLLHPTASIAQVFTDLRDARFYTIAGVASTSEGAVVIGNGGGGEFGPAIRWTKSTGSVPLNLPVLFPYEFRVEDISADGSVLVGRGSSMVEPPRPSAYRWTSSGGYQELASNIRDASLFSLPAKVSGDGSVVTGFGSIAAFRWQQETGTVSIGAKLDGNDVISSENPLFRPRAISEDGSVIVGEKRAHQDRGGEATSWTKETGLVGLGLIIERVEYDSTRATAVSGDGSLIAGTAVAEPSQYESPYSQAFRWSQETGMVRIADGTFVTAMSSNGSLIVGGVGPYLSNSDPFVWTPGFPGMKLLVDVLTKEYGIGNDIAGWDLGWITALSRDGRYIAGFGTAPNNRHGYWLVDLAPTVTPVPEPETYGLLGALGLLSAIVARRRRRALSV